MMRGYLGPFSLPPHSPPFVNPFVNLLSSFFDFFFEANIRSVVISEIDSNYLYKLWEKI